MITHLVEPLVYDYSQIADASMRTLAQRAADEIKPRLRRATEDILIIGQRLAVVREYLPHGQWMDWIEAEFEMGDETARNFINVATRFNGKFQNFGNLKPSALYMLAAPSTPDEAIAEVETHLANGYTPTVAETKQIIAEHKPTSQLSVNLPGEDWTRPAAGKLLVDWTDEDWAGHQAEIKAAVTAVADAPTEPGAPATAPTICQHCGKRQADVSGKPYCVTCWHKDLTDGLYCPQCHAHSTLDKQIGHYSAAQCWSCKKYTLKTLWLTNRVTKTTFGQAVADAPGSVSAQKTKLSDEEEIRIATDWLSAYRGPHGANWSQMTDSQIHHANSPCFQAWTKAHPEVRDHKLRIKQAMYQLRRRAGALGASASATRQAVADAPGSDDKNDLSPQRTHTPLPAEEGREWQRIQGLHGALAKMFILLTGEHRTTAEAYGFGVEYERLLGEVESLRREVKGLRPDDKVTG